ncbi:MAG: hypothetical protein KDB61_06645, partial [Planctomycetes bacterium]|nr:hypothetical protein [Planctomycetota bacterium]
MSKSWLQRALLAGAWAGGRSRLAAPIDLGIPGSQGQDVADWILALGALGLCVLPDAESGGRQWILEGAGFDGLPHCTVALGESGTAARLATALLAYAGQPGHNRRLGVSGTLLQRRSPALVACLREHGISVRTAGPGTWPLEVVSGELPAALVLRDPGSSQEVSALLFAIAFEGGRELRVEGPIPSRPYVDMTLAVLAGWGVAFDVQEGCTTRFVRGTGAPAPPDVFPLECDASSAAVAWAGGLLAGIPVRVGGIPKSSLQGDLAMVEHLAKVGVAVDFDRDGG